MATAKATVIRLCANVPLDISHNHTINFGSAEAQQSYFVSKQVDVKSNLSYQRESWTVDYPAEYDKIISANYLCFQNPSYGPKWFYAFITRMEYVSDMNTRIYFKIDSYQTYLFDFTVGQGFVEREHVSDDVPGNYLLDEPVALGEYVVDGIEQKNFSRWKTVLGMVPDGTTIFFEGKITGNVYTGLAFQAFDTPEDVNSFLENLGTKIDAVVIMYMLPTEFTSGDLLPDDPPRGLSFKLPPNETINGYTPKNKKLLTYPYCGVLLHNNEGAGITLRYEYMITKEIKYTSGSMAYSRIVAFPNDYMGIGSPFEQSISLSTFPQCAWNRNTFEVWNSLQSVRNAYTKDRFFVNAIANAAGGTLTGGTSGAQMGATLSPDPYTTAAGAAVGAMGAVAGSAVTSALDYYNIESSISEEREVHQMMPNNSGGAVANGPTNIAYGKYGFVAERKVINAEHARTIDDFFSAFGYKVNRLKVPNINTRTNWNYVKCQTIVLSGKVPYQYLEEIRQMFLNGVTIWHTTDVGNYSLPNGVRG